MSAINTSRRGILRLGAAAGAGAVLATSGGVRAEEKASPVSLFAVAFEVQPHPDRREEYLATAKELRPLLEAIDGFDSIDRFECRARPGWLLSLSLWSDEAALVKWRTQERHHLAQANGRAHVFADYRIRVAQVMAEDDFVSVTRRPERRSAYNDRSRRTLAYMSFLEVTPLEGAAPAMEVPPYPSDVETWNSLYHPGKVVYSALWATEQEAERYPGGIASWVRSLSTKASVRLLLVEVERDYTLRGRDKAPQYYPPVS